MDVAVDPSLEQGIPFRILVVDDEAPIRTLLRTFLEPRGCSVQTLDSGYRALELLQSQEFDLVLLDIMMPDSDGIETAALIREQFDSLPVFMMTAYATVDRAVEAMKHGATEFLMKPLSLEVLGMLVENVRRVRDAAPDSTDPSDEVQLGEGGRVLLTRDRRMQEVLRLVGKVAPLPSTVLVQGESGTGKELIARALHERSPRKNNSFVALNCSVVPGELLASELFGYEKGAFTGAGSRKIGYFEAAQGGTIFLDEISEMDVDLQAKLLRVIQERSFQRLGGTGEITTDVRIVASTNRDLESEVHAGRFRQDLYYRINVVRIVAPPLRDRQTDVPLLAYHFLAKYSEEFGKTIEGIKPQAIEVLLRHDWPGNVRELQNVIEHAVAVAEHSKITVKDLPLELQKSRSVSREARPPKAYQLAKHDFEREYLELLLEQTHGNLSLVSKLSEIPRQNIYGKLEKHNISPDDYR